MPNLTTFILMAKAPRPGRVKTRLCPPLTPEQAADVASAFVADLGHRLAARPGCRLEVALPPGDEPGALRDALPPDTAFVNQGPGDLGERLVRVFGRAFGGGAARVLALGSDHPNLPPALLDGALEAARGDAAGWVPTRDGGYACLALARPMPELFAGVPWSTPRVGDVTRNHARRLGVSLVAPGRWYDIDTIDDLRRLARDPDSLALCPRTMHCLERIGVGGDAGEEARHG